MPEICKVIPRAGKRTGKNKNGRQRTKKRKTKTKDREQKTGNKNGRQRIKFSRITDFSFREFSFFSEKQYQSAGLVFSLFFPAYSFQHILSGLFFRAYSFRLILQLILFSLFFSAYSFQLILFFNNPDDRCLKKSIKKAVCLKRHTALNVPGKDPITLSASFLLFPACRSSQLQGHRCCGST